MVKITEKKKVKAVRNANERVNEEIEVKVEVKEKSKVDEWMEMVDRVIENNMNCEGRKLLKREEVESILNSLLR